MNGFPPNPQGGTLWKYRRLPPSPQGGATEEVWKNIAISYNTSSAVPPWGLGGKRQSKLSIFNLRNAE